MGDSSHPTRPDVISCEDMHVLDALCIPDPILLHGVPSCPRGSWSRPESSEVLEEMANRDASRLEEERI